MIYSWDGVCYFCSILIVVGSLCVYVHFTSESLLSVIKNVGLGVILMHFCFVFSQVSIAANGATREKAQV